MFFRVGWLLSNRLIGGCMMKQFQIFDFRRIEQWSKITGLQLNYLETQRDDSQYRTLLCFWFWYVESPIWHQLVLTMFTLQLVLWMCKEWFSRIWLPDRGSLRQVPLGFKDLSQKRTTYALQDVIYRELAHRKTDRIQDLFSAMWQLKLDHVAFWRQYKRFVKSTIFL